MYICIYRNSNQQPSALKAGALDSLDALTGILADIRKWKVAIGKMSVLEGIQINKDMYLYQNVFLSVQLSLSNIRFACFAL